MEYAINSPGGDDVFRARKLPTTYIGVWLKIEHLQLLSSLMFLSYNLRVVDQ